MQTLTLRDYQQESVDQLYRYWDRGVIRVMLQLSTGGGKSKIFSQLAIDARKIGWRVLVLAHTEELVLQNAAHLESYLPGQVGIIKAGQKKTYWSPVQSASIQTLVNRLDKVGDFDLVIHDEAHHSCSNTSLKILDRYPKAKRVGLTATPIRTDGKGFEEIFDKLICGPQTSELIEMGHLSKYIIPADPRPMQRTQKLGKDGDYDLEDLARLNNATELAGRLIDHYRLYANGGSCIVFAINCEHSIEIAKKYNEAGIPALHLDAKASKEERGSALEKLNSGEVKVISNVGLYGEGVDIPNLSCVQNARPTNSLSLWLQICGRVLRVAGGKEYGVIIDHTPNWFDLGIPCDRRKWQLEGTPKKEPVKKNPEEIVAKEKEKQEKAIIRELKELTLVPIPTQSDGEAYWDGLLVRLISQQEDKGHSPRWVQSKIADKYPPLRIWVKLAEHIGKPEDWAEKCYFDQSRELATQALRAVVKSEEPARAIAAVRSRWQDPELLQTAQKFLQVDQRQKLYAIVDNDNKTRLQA
jgi:superfamily II DNA or RNA helicase